MELFEINNVFKIQVEWSSNFSCIMHSMVQNDWIEENDFKVSAYNIRLHI